MATPLTDLLKKEGFKWFVVAEKTLYDLKEVVTNPLVLALPNFSLPFEVDCDVSGKAMGVVLMQKELPIAFFSQDLSMSTYKNEWQKFHPF